MKKTITMKRADLYREWLLAILANDERYYIRTLALGIPDGDDEETVMADLQDGVYDDDIDDTIEVYLSAKRSYSGAGYYVGHVVYYDENAALEAAGYTIPSKIYMKH